MKHRIPHLAGAVFFLLLAALLPAPVSAQAAEPAAVKPPVRVAWDSYRFGPAPADGEPAGWKPLAGIRSDPAGKRGGGELWLRVRLPEEQAKTGHLAVYSYTVKNDAIALFLDGTPIFASDNGLPAGFLSWRIVPYEPAGSGAVLTARLSPEQYLEEGFEVWTGDVSALTLKLLRTEAPMWGGAILLTLFSVCSLLSYLFHRSQPLFLYFFLFFASIAVDLTVLWGGWQFLFDPDDLMLWGSLVHFNWYLGHASGILITHSIVSAKGSIWIRNLAYAVLLYGAVALAGWLVAGEQAQLAFYRLFYDYLSTSILLLLALVLIRALWTRKDAEIRIFAVGNALFIGGVIIGRALSEGIWPVPVERTLLTSYHAMTQIGWTFVGFAGALCSLGVLMGLRLLRMAQLRTTNERMQRMNDALQASNAKLARIDEIRSTMYSEVSHELNTPVTAIKGYAQLMLNGTVAAGETRYLQVIHDKAVMMERMIDNMLEIVRLENKHAAFDCELLPFAALFGKLCAKAGLDLAAHDRVFSWSLEGPAETADGRIPAVYGDGVRIEQVLVNLLSNARKFTPPGGAIRAEAAVREDEQAIVIRIIDSGPGIPPEEQDSIFERFYRGRAAKAAEVAGTGLGLPICREIMDAHGGSIGLERSDEGGSTFVLRFPLRLAAPEELYEG